MQSANVTDESTELSRAFQFEGREVRVLMPINDTTRKEAYFEAVAIAENLGHKNPRQALATHCKGVRHFASPTPGGAQRVAFIPESDVYRLIAGSHTQGAERFKDWMFEEVLPSIRKHGAYMTPSRIEEILDNPDTIIRLATNLKAERAARKKAVRDQVPF